MWEAAAALRFLATFRRRVPMSQLVSAGDLEAALVRDAGDSDGPLARLHGDLLAALAGRARAGAARAAAAGAAGGGANWAAALHRRLEAAGVADECFPLPERGSAARAYAALPATTR